MRDCLLNIPRDISLDRTGTALDSEYKTLILLLAGFRFSRLKIAAYDCYRCCITSSNHLLELPKMSDLQPKSYDLIVFGATGYTGKLCAEYIYTCLPTNLKWAVAGRSEKKLLAMMDEIGLITTTDRLQPGQFPVL